MAQLALDWCLDKKVDALAKLHYDRVRFIDLDATGKIGCYITLDSNIKSCVLDFGADAEEEQAIEEGSSTENANVNANGNGNGANVNGHGNGSTTVNNNSQKFKNFSTWTQSNDTTSTPFPHSILEIRYDCPTPQLSHKIQQLISSHLVYKVDDLNFSLNNYLFTKHFSSGASFSSHHDNVELTDYTLSNCVLPWFDKLDSDKFDIRKLPDLQPAQDGDLRGILLNKSDDIPTIPEEPEQEPTERKNRGWNEFDDGSEFGGDGGFYVDVDAEDGYGAGGILGGLFSGLFGHAKNDGGDGQGEEVIQEGETVGVLNAEKIGVILELSDKISDFFDKLNPFSVNRGDGGYDYPDLEQQPLLLHSNANYPSTRSGSVAGHRASVVGGGTLGGDGGRKGSMVYYHSFGTAGARSSSVGGGPVDDEDDMYVSESDCDVNGFRKYVSVRHQNSTSSNGSRSGSGSGSGVMTSGSGSGGSSPIDSDTTSVSDYYSHQSNNAPIHGILQNGHGQTNGQGHRKSYLEQQLQFHNQSQQQVHFTSQQPQRSPRRHSEFDNHDKANNNDNNGEFQSYHRSDELMKQINHDKILTFIYLSCTLICLLVSGIGFGVVVSIINDTSFSNPGGNNGNGGAGSTSNVWILIFGLSCQFLSLVIGLCGLCLMMCRIGTVPLWHTGLVWFGFGLVTLLFVFSFCFVF
ncbi:unnamed protein product [Ambrosiozyma monospora]|uniref:Unnamed protein product n=1 Tax=Ambrosiozyma monospora TaxID=43982 RepID=A0ACB5T015_AMBMO|nr:unnamed protein product [Ambrosiozyma monospora]